MRSYSYRDEENYYRDRWARRAGPRASFRTAGPYLDAFLGSPRGYFAGKRVLDLGAGECMYTEYMRRCLDPACVVALDRFMGQIAPAKTDPGSSGVHFTIGDCFSLPFSGGSFDVVFCHLVLHHLPDLDTVAAEVRRVLRPSGRFLAIEPNPLNLRHLFRLYSGRHGSPNEYILWPRHFRAFEEAGFRTEVSYFYPKWGTRSRFLSSSMGLKAQLRGCDHPADDAVNVS